MAALLVEIYMYDDIDYTQNENTIKCSSFRYIVQEQRSDTIALSDREVRSSESLVPQHC